MDTAFILRYCLFINNTPPCPCCRTMAIKGDTGRTRIILLGVIHLRYAFPLQVNENMLWYVGAGMAVIFAGLINFVAVERGGSKFSLIIAVIVNALNFGMFCFALAVYNEPFCYINLTISGISTIAFIATLIKTYKISN
jgi:hypothetical protein